MKLTLLLFVSVSKLAKCNETTTIETQTSPSISEYYALHRSLFSNYNKDIRANVGTENGPVNVTIDLVLYSIKETDELHEAISFNVWFHMEWTETLFRWDPDNYGGIMQTEIASDKIWLPDVVLMGIREVKEEPKKASILCDVYSHGVVHCEFNQILISHCDYQIKSFPYDKQNCSFQFSSWKYGIRNMDIKTNSTEGNIKFFKPNNEWHLISFDNHRVVQGYSRESFAVVYYHLIICRKPLHYVMTLILPSFLITTLAIVGLFTPFSSTGERQEKVTMGLTMLLTMSVLLLVVSEQMPKTSTGMPPFLGLYILFEFALGAVGVCFTVVIMHFERRAQDNLEPSPWMISYLRIDKDKIDVGTNHENDLYDKAKRLWIRRGQGTYGTNSLIGTENNSHSAPHEEYMGPNIMEMVKLLKCCFAHLETIAKFIENENHMENLKEKWRVICYRLDWICLISLLVFNCILTFLLLLIYGLKS